MRIAVGDVELEVERYGAGPPVLFINGSGASLAMDPHRARHPLTAAFEVVLYDQRGLGATVGPDREYTMADYAADAAGLLDALGIARAHVVGVSFGGMVAQHLAIERPDLVERLVLACTSSGGEGGSSYDLLRHEALPPAERLVAMAARLDARNDLAADPPVVAPGLEGLIGVLRARLGDRPDPVAEVGRLRQLRARQGHDAWAGLPSVTAPTLVIGGRFDAQAPPENLERLAARIPGAELVLCDGGHLFLSQDPTAWPTVLAFLQRTP